MHRYHAILMALFVSVPGSSDRVFAAVTRTGNFPNIIYILADDLGYGDVRALNPASMVETPEIDRLAKSGMCFTDAHSGSAVCSPTRYGIMTGRYCWRTGLKAGVLNHSSHSLIESSRMTVASLLKKHGYATACVGKWHLGLERPGTKVDYRKNISFGPNQLGFDYAFYSVGTPGLRLNGREVTQGGIDPAKATQEQLTGAWIENGKLLADGLRDWKQNEVGPTLARVATNVIEQHAKNRPQSPLFLYLALSAVHNPVVPAAFCKGKSVIGPYGDFIGELDWTVGEVLKALDQNRMRENTLVVFTSDNGADKGGLKTGLEKLGHDSSHVFRGGKADIFEGGHRIPFIVRWPGKTKAGSTSDETICLTDLLATCGALVGEKLPPGAGEDSYDILPVMMGKELGQPVREATVHHSLFGVYAIRQGPWKLIFSRDSGGWSAPKPGTVRSGPPVQLYHLRKDIGESSNLSSQHPEVVARLTRLLDRYKAEGRSNRP